MTDMIPGALFLIAYWFNADMLSTRFSVSLLIGSQTKHLPTFNNALLILIFFCPFASQAQIFYSTFYPERSLLNNLQQANTAAGRIDAAGKLAQYYKSKFQDSLSAIYFRIADDIAGSADDPRLHAKVLWWSAHIHAGITAFDETKQATAMADSLLHLALIHGFTAEAIAANILLTDIYIHKDLNRAELYAVTAQQLLNNWNHKGVDRDSFLLEVYYRLTHVYIHKKEGEHAAYYLFAQQDYAEKSGQKVIRMQATDNVAQLYQAWPGQESNAQLWIKNLYDQYKKTGEKNKLFIVAYMLSNNYINRKDTVTAKRYFDEAQQIQDTFRIATIYEYWLALEKRSLGLLTNQGFVQLLDNHFNGHLCLPPALIDIHKTYLYLAEHQMDSANHYFLKARKDRMDELSSYFPYYNVAADYYLQNREYDKAIEALNVFGKKEAEQLDRDKYMQALLGLSAAYEGKGDYKTSISFLHLYYQKRDSLEKLNYNVNVSFMELQRERQRNQNEAVLHQQNISRYMLYVIIGLISLILIGIYFFFWYRLRQLRLKNQLTKEKADKALAETQYQQRVNEITFAALRSQMNPHFIFNALNTVQGFVYSNDKKSASAYLGKFSQLIRKILDDSQQESVSLQEEIEMLQLYTDIEKARFGGNFNVQLYIDPQLQADEIMVVPMLIQPYVENAIKHGLFHKSGEKNLTIQIRQSFRTDEIKVIIDDDGIGRERSLEINKNKPGHHSFATAANEKRIDLINRQMGRNARVEIIDKTNSDGSSAGTTVIITIAVILPTVV